MAVSTVLMMTAEIERHKRFRVFASELLRDQRLRRSSSHVPAQHDRWLRVHDSFIILRLAVTCTSRFDRPAEPLRRRCIERRKRKY